MQTELYSDGIGEITITGSIVRVDLMSLSPTERDANNNPKSVIRQRVIFTVEGFANSVDLMQKALRSLVDAGVVKRTHPPGAPTEVQDADAGPYRDNGSGAQRGKISPNFR